MVNIIEDWQLRWSGHVRRMGEDRKAKQAYEMRVEERYGRGRPRITWENGNSKDRTKTWQDIG